MGTVAQRHVLRVGLAGRSRACAAERTALQGTLGSGQAVGADAMRHPLSTTVSGGLAECAVAVGDVGGLVVEHALAKAVPQHLQPAVAERSEGGVVGLAAGALGVVELPGPAGLAQRAERP